MLRTKATYHTCDAAVLGFRRAIIDKERENEAAASSALREDGLEPSRDTD